MADLTGLRTAVVSKMIADATLITLLGGGSIKDKVKHDTPHAPEVVPGITFMDIGNTPDPTVPLHDRVVRITGWAATLADAAALASRVRKLFHAQPLTVADTGWRFMGMYANDDEETPIEDGDVMGQTVAFRLLAYEVA